MRRGLFSGRWGLLLLIAVHSVVELSPWPPTMYLRTMTNQPGKGQRAGAPEACSRRSFLSLEGTLRPRCHLRRLLSISGCRHRHQLPAIVWVGGGAWLSGDKDQVANYLRILPGRGSTTLGADYSLARQQIPDACRAGEYPAGLPSEKCFAAAHRNFVVVPRR